MRLAPGRMLCMLAAGTEPEPPMTLPTPLAAPFSVFDLIDPTRLADHARQCVLARGRWHRLRCAAEATHAFVAPRFVTTLMLWVLVLAVLSAF